MYKGIIKYYILIIVFISAFQTIYGQDSYTVKGKIVTSNGKPINNVSVSVVGVDAAPVVTDEEGNFTIQTPSGNEWLIIDPLAAYKNKRVFLNNRKEMVIYLSEIDMRSGHDDIATINQINIKRRDIVGSFTELEMDMLGKRNIITIDQAFQGKVPGVFTTSHSGMPGQGAVSFLRGINSMHASNSPLVVVDGMPIENTGIFESNIDGNEYNPLTSIDPADISEVTILKDPSMTSVYGSKAANGVILINTLEPKSTETTINASLRSGYNVAAQDFIPQLNDVQYKSLANEVLITSPSKEENFSEDYPGLYMNKGDKSFSRYNHNTNWQDMIYADGLSMNAYLSVKGGSDIARYGLSVGYHNEEGTFKNTSYDRFNVRLVSDLNIFSWFQMKINANLTNSNAFLMESAISTQTSPMHASLAKPPIMGPYQYDNEGNQLSLIDNVDELGTSNPLAVTSSFKGENKNYRLLSSVLGLFQINENLTFNSLVGLNFNTMKESVFMPNNGMELYADEEAYNVAQHTNNFLYTFNNNSYFEYSGNIDGIHEFKTALGLRVQTNTLQVDFGEAMNMPENDQFQSLQSGQNDLRKIEGSNALWNWMSLYNQITYKYKDKYVFNTGISADFSSLTGKEAETAFNMMDMPFGLFYSMGAGWRISEEIFLKNIHAIENLFLRASYGTNGNGDIGNYNALDYYKLSRYRETSVLVPGGLPNESLKYEENQKFNAGLNVSLWGSRTRLMMDYFLNTTKDMVIYEAQENYTGFTFKPTNGGEVQNRGLELSVFQRIIDGQHFEWDFSTALSFVSNEVTEIKGDKLVTAFVGGEFVTMEGKPINSFYGYQFEGVFKNSAEADSANLINDKGIPFGPGDAIYKDISGPDTIPDGQINNYDKVTLGSPMPEFFGSISNRFKYKRWSLDVMLQFVYGNEMYNYNRYLNERMSDLSNQSQHVLKRWQHEGDETNVPRALWNDPVGNSDFSSRWIEDGSYMRLKNITLGYSIQEAFLFFKNAEIYLSANNLLTFHRYLGFDPEFSYSYDVMNQGIDYGLMPQYRQFIVGFNLGL